MNKLKPKTRVEILDDIQRFIRRHGATMNAWYVGTAVSAKEQLFQTHGLKQSDIGLYREASSADDATSIASFLIGRGTQGDATSRTGAVFVYAFKKSDHTCPSS